MRPMYRWLATVCLLIVLALPGMSAQEFRGLYVDAFHPGFKTHEETTRMVAAARAANFNALIVQIRKRGDAYYNSGIEPKASDVDAEYDPLADIIKQAHAARLEVHAWLSVYEVSHESYTLSENHVCRKHPEWIMKGKDGGTSFFKGKVYLDPGIPAVNEYTVSVIRDILTRYEVDGIHLDNVRYPSEEGGYNDTAVALFSEQSGTTESPEANSKPWLQWRCRQVTGLVREVQKAIRTTNASAKLSASVMLQNPQDAARIVLQEWDAWTSDGLVDFLIPMVYAKEDTMAGNARCALKYANSRHVYIGIGTYRLPKALTNKHIADCRAEGALGMALYSYHYLCTASDQDGHAKLSDIAASAFGEPVELPAMSWR